MDKPLNFEHLRRQAKDLLQSWRKNESLDRLPPGTKAPYKLASAQFALAREQGFASWADLKNSIAVPASPDELRDLFFRLALGQGYQLPQREKARKLLTANPGLASLGAPEAALASRADLLSARGPEILNQPLSWSGQEIPLLHLAAAGLGDSVPCLDLVLDWGADPNETHTVPEFEGAAIPPLYYASGVARSRAATERLLAAGANPTDGESLYHASESEDTGPLEALLLAGGVWHGNDLARLLDFEDMARLELALKHGGDKHIQTERPDLILHALQRGRSLAVIDRLIEAGADMRATGPHGHSVYLTASLKGRQDIVARLEQRGVKEELPELLQFLSACAAPDRDKALALAPSVMPQIPEMAYRLLPDQAQLGRLEPVKLMVELGFPVAHKGDWGASAANQAAFNGDDAMLRFLMENGAHWTEMNGYGGDVWGSIYWASGNLGASALVGRHVECARVLLEAGSPVPDLIRGSDDVMDFLEEWLIDHPDWPREELS